MALSHMLERSARTCVPLMLLLFVPGCVGLTSQVLYMMNGLKTPAEYSDLAKKRVAVVCVSKSTAYGTGTEANIVCRKVASTLKREVKDIQVVPQSEIDDWIDKKGWNELDYREVGRGVDADMVVAIDLDVRSLYEAQQIFRGKADVTVTVYDMLNDGEVAYRQSMPDVTFPTTGVYFPTDMNEAKFRRAFLEHLAEIVAKRFYAYDKVEDFGRDRPTVGD